MSRLIAFALSLLLFTVALALPAGAAEFTFEKYFAGRTVANGQFRAINGVNRKFKVVLNGSWNGKRLKLVENFAYADGERDRKTWTFVKTGPHTYTGTREDVRGQALVTITGDMARYAYDVYLDAAAKKNLVRFHDTMVLGNDGVVVNKAYVTKFGLPVAWTRVDFHR